MNNSTDIRQLEEGEVYLFYVNSIGELPDKGKIFIMVDPLGTKHLLEYSAYRQYDFNPGQKVKCRIDKINCDGKVFIEPEHPFYKTGEVYNFEFVRLHKKGNLFGSYDLFAIVRDVFNHDTHVMIMANKERFIDTSIDSLDCRVDRIKNGNLILSDPESFENIYLLEVGEIYKFRIVNDFHSPNGHDYYILEDPNSQKHLLPVRYYKNYHFRIGQVIKCEIVKQSSKGSLLLEPNHPFYGAGYPYSFKIVEFNEKYIVVEDIFGDKNSIKIDPERIDEYSKMTSVTCLVEGFRKGRLVLALPEYR